ncbi:MAG: hypothetical protein HZC41_22275 [Chloroflexi bacterium]|nr:hypothetical protein [Chloroflexota bacterium]
MSWDDDLYDDNAEPIFERRRVRRSIPESVYYGDEDDDAPGRSSRARRILYLILVLLTLLAFLAYELYFLFQGSPPPTPAPTPLPLNLI